MRTVKFVKIEVVAPKRKMIPVIKPRREMGVPKILEKEELVAESQLKKLLMSQRLPAPIPSGK